MNYGKALFFAAGIGVGIGVACFVKSKMGKKAAVAVVSQGLKLKDCVASMAERAKEAADDVIAEAKYINEQKA